MIGARIDTGPSKYVEKESAETEKITTPASEALKENIDYIIRHASGKGLSQEEE
jgi:hypothetical protein